MELKTKRLILRKPKLSDWKDIVEGIGDYDVAKRLSSAPYPYFKQDAIDWIKKAIKNWKNKENFHFFIELKSEKKIIGDISLLKINYYNGVSETGSWINRKYWRNGYITEAKISIIDYAFNKLKLRRLESFVSTNNEASNGAQKKMGYQLEGMKRKAVKHKTTGKIHDLNMYGLLKEDWKKKRPSLIKKIKDKK